MRSPFVRFTVIFVALVVCAGAAWFFVTHRGGEAAPRETAPRTATLPPAGTVPAPPPGQSGSTPSLPDNPPDINGLNYTEVAIPGSQLSAAPPVQPQNPASNTAGDGDYVAELLARKLALPIEGTRPQDLTDTFNDPRTASRHEATDIMSPTGTPVHAFGEGNIVKLFLSKRGGLTIYQFDDDQKYCFYYAHLDRYAPLLKEGMLVRPGDVIGYVGSTGDANPNAPHLHFAISRLNPDKHYWQGTALDPYPVLVKLAERH